MKKKFRKIVVNDNIYSWRLAEKVDIRPENNKSNKLLIDFGWHDVWLYINDQENKPNDFKPKSITPIFVRSAIEFALNNKWDIEQKNRVINILYNNEEFTILSNETNNIDSINKSE